MTDLDLEDSEMDCLLPFLSSCTLFSFWNNRVLNFTNQVWFQLKKAASFTAIMIKEWQKAGL